MLINFFRNKLDDVKYYYENDVYHINFSSNNCLAFRRSSYKEDVAYNAGLPGGEDVHFCLLHLKAKNRYCVNRYLRVEHLPRESTYLLFKQYFNYGKYFVGALSKINYKEFEIFVDNFLSMKPNKRAKSFKSKLPFRFLMYYSSFYLFLLGIVLLTIFKSPLCYFLSCLMILKYILSDIRMLSTGWKKSLQLAWARFGINSSLLFGALISYFKYYIIVFPPMLEYCDEKVLHFKISSSLSVDKQSIYKNEISSFNGIPIENQKLNSLGKNIYHYKIDGLHLLLQKRFFFYGFTLLDVGTDLHELLWKE